jgi:parallel beta-helix repeat protein
VSNIRRTLILIAFFLFFFSLISNVYAATPVLNCTVIDSPGEYYLTQDISGSAASPDEKCIDIQADNVVLDCQGHTIYNSDHKAGIGIYTNGYSGITISNCYLYNWQKGVYIQNSNSNTITNIYGDVVEDMIKLVSSNYNTISNIGGYVTLWYSSSNNISNINVLILLYSSSDNNISYVNGRANLQYSNNNRLSNIMSSGSWHGIEIAGSNYNKISDSQVTNSGEYGIYIYLSSNNEISNVTLDSNPVGIRVENSNNNVIRDSVIKNSGSYGIQIISSRNNQIYNNIFNNNNNFYFGGAIYTNYWNTTLQPGINIWNSSLGYIGGNLWTTPDNNGYSDTCVDANYDGFCDNPYTLGTNNIDYLPIAKYVGQNIPSFSVVFNYDSVDFGTVTPNTIAEAKSINYNVSITTNTDYKVSVNATDWSGPTTIPANTLYFAVNDTLDKLSFAAAKQLSNVVQQVAIFPSTVTTNYHAFYFNVPVVPVGTYTATVTITYEVV